MLKRDLQQFQSDFFLQRKTAIATGATWLFRRSLELDSISGEQIADEFPMRRRDAFSQRPPGHAALMFDREVFGNEYVHPVRLTVNLLVDPFQLELELIGRKSGRTKNPEAAGATDRRHDVTAMAERHQWEFDAEHFTYAGFHRRILVANNSGSGQPHLTLPRRHWPLPIPRSSE